MIFFSTRTDFTPVQYTIRRSTFHPESMLAHPVHTLALRALEIVVHIPETGIGHGLDAVQMLQTRLPDIALMFLICW